MTVLSAIEAVLQANGYDIIPRFSATTCHATAGNIPTLDSRVYDDAREVARQQQIAATTYNNIWY